jgi:hypothetical protein
LFLDYYHSLLSNLPMFQPWFQNLVIEILHPCIFTVPNPFVDFCW